MSKNWYAVYAVSANDVMHGAKFSAQDMIAAGGTAEFTNINATRDGLERFLGRPTDTIDSKQPGFGFGYGNKQQVFMPSVVVSARVEPDAELTQRLEANIQEPDRFTIHPAGHGGHVTNNTTVNGVTTLPGLGLHQNDNLFQSTELDSKIIIGADALHKAEVVYDAAKVQEILQARQADLQKIVQMGERSTTGEMARLDLSRPEGLQAVRFAYAPDGYVQQPPAYNPADRYGHRFFEEIANECSAETVAKLPAMYQDYTKQLQAYKEKFPDMLPATQAAYAMRNAIIMNSPVNVNCHDAVVMKYLEDAATTHMGMSANVVQMANEYCEKAGINPRSEMGQYFTRELAMAAFTQGGTAAELAMRTVEKVGQDGYDVAAPADFKALHEYAEQALHEEQQQDALRLYGENDSMDTVDLE